MNKGVFGLNTGSREEDGAGGPGGGGVTLSGHSVDVLLRSSSLATAG